MTSESPEQPLPDTSLGFMCFVREKPACPVDLGYQLARGQCVKMYQELKNHGDARSKCEEDGGHLYYYTDLTTDEPVINELQAATMTKADIFWVGADRLTTSDYQWHDGCPLPDSDPIWKAGEPNGLGSHESCVEVVTANMLLNDFTCSGQSYFICQIDV
ncbi:hypothetical protein V1264_014340 [Littorina saxatilis]